MKPKRIVVAVFTVTMLIMTSGSSNPQVTHVAAAIPPQPVQGVNTLESTLDALLRQSGYAYGKVKANSWYVNMRGRELTNIRILIGAGGSSIAVGAVVAPKRQLSVTAESMFKMMKLSYDLNYVRVCIDPDDDLLVMAQVKGRSIDLQEFKDVIERVAAAADRAYVEVRPFLRTP